MRGVLLAVLLLSLYACDRSPSQLSEPKATTSTPATGVETGPDKAAIAPSVPGSLESFSSKPEDAPSAPRR
jgi:hypothetical protein